jgi:hypothetical protein
MLEGRMALLWTGNDHVTYEKVDVKRDLDKVFKAGVAAKDAVYEENFKGICEATAISYDMQIGEGMKELPVFNEISKKYCGGGWGGYAVYLFENSEERQTFLEKENTLKIEPFLSPKS